MIFDQTDRSTLVRKLRKLRRHPRRFLADSTLFAPTYERAHVLLERWAHALRPAEQEPPPQAATIEPEAPERASRLRFERQFGTARCAERPFFNFGAGSWRHPYFQNIDIQDPNYPGNNPDIVYDAFDAKPFPIATSSAEHFYFSHVNEHLPDRINDWILRETYRCLRPGGTIRIVYPDVDLAYAAYLRDDREFFIYDWWRGASSVRTRSSWPAPRLFLDFFATRATPGSPDDGNRKWGDNEVATMLTTLGLPETCDRIASGMLERVQRRRPNTHFNWWNHAKFERTLGCIGFTRIERSAYLQSRVPPLRDPNFFDIVFPHMSGYVECVKPG